MSDQKMAAELVDALHRPDGSPHLRPVHSIGTGASGYFIPSHEAKRYCIAEQFQDCEGRTPVTVRFSNGSGSQYEHDGWSDVRGMATRFHLASGVETDLVAMTLPEFFAPTPESFLAFCKAAFPRPFKRETFWQKVWDYLCLELPKRDPYPGETIRPDEGAIVFADAHDYAQLSVFEAAGIGAPKSYARAAYHAVHTFIVTDPEGVRRWVRFQWEPAAGVLNRDPNKPPEDVYLAEELRKRIQTGPVRFTLMMVIGETGDAFDDSTRPWPPHRRRMVLGDLYLDELLAQDLCERLNFNPCRLVNGIEPSDDPVLHIRRLAYEISGKRRGATLCPFAGSPVDAA